MTLQWKFSHRRTGPEHGNLRFAAQDGRHTYEATNQIHGASWLALHYYDGRLVGGKDFNQRSSNKAREWCEQHAWARRNKRALRDL